MDISNFIFLGFLPKRKIKILEVLKKNLSIGVPVVIFANSKTLKLILHIIKDNFDGTYVSISKEISKINEKTISGSTDEILRDINNSFYNKGEFVLIAKAQIEESVNNSDLKDLISFLQILKEEDVSFKKSVEILNKKFSISKKIIYSEALKMWDKN